MRIKNIRTKETETHITLLADCKIRPYTWDTVHFTFDKKYKDGLVLDASSLAAAFLIPSMIQGSDLVVEGTVSKKLSDGMHTLMDTIVNWKWDRVKLHRIDIKIKDTTEDTYQPKNVATFFSGGVDSFYTFLKHRNDTTDKITHFILIKGNDITPENEALWESTLASVMRIAQKSGIELVVVESNFQPLIEPMIDQGYTHGGALAAVGLCMRNYFKKIYIPGTFSRRHDIKYGSHPDIDHFWNSESISFVHDGDEATRLEKVDWQIAKSPLALDELRVCYMNVKGTYNCGVCEKCCRTMLELVAAGKLEEAKTFPHELDLSLVKKIASESGVMGVNHEELLALLKERHIRPDIQRALEEGLALNSKNHLESHWSYAESLIKLDYIYFHGFFRGLFRKLK